MILRFKSPGIGCIVAEHRVPWAASSKRFNPLFAMNFSYTSYGFFLFNIMFIIRIFGSSDFASPSAKKSLPKWAEIARNEAAVAGLYELMLS